MLNLPIDEIVVLQKLSLYGLSLEIWYDDLYSRLDDKEERDESAG